MRNSKKYLEDLASGFMPARVLLTAVEIGVFGSLGAEALDSAELARRTKTEPESLERLLNALVALEIITKRNGRYRNSPAARKHLVEGAREFLGDIMLHRCALWETWGNLTRVVRTGKVPPRRRTRERERHFIRGMANIGAFSARQTVRALERELGSVKRLLDVGGGPATYACAFARHRPGMRVTVLDLPGPLQYARETIRQEDLRDRVSVRAGDALRLKSYGRGYDMVFLSNFIHSFKRPDAASVIRKAAGALSRGGILAIKDFYIERDGTAPPFTALFSINMLVADAGDSFSREEVDGWMEDAGVQPIRFVKIAHASGILVGRRG